MITALAAVMMGLSSCNKDELSPVSVVTDTVSEPTEFDLWLEENYRAPYNIRFLYRYEDIESDMDYDVAPAYEICSRVLAKVIKYLWLDPYAEVADVDFVRENAPRVMAIIGSGAYSGGTIRLGTAEGGLKITFYVANRLIQNGIITVTYNDPEDESAGYTVTVNDVDAINDSYLQTAHHEFGHILNQNKDYPTDFDLISQGDYVAQWTDVDEDEALQMGFITDYASSAASEDFVEVLSHYITLSDEEWADRMETAGEEGSAIIERKLTIVRNYMMDSWDIDIDRLRAVLARRYGELSQVDWTDFSTEE